jgi:Ca2+-binding EF-hand superfamily protein
MLFEHFDANHDGFVAEDELPPNLPEPIKAALKVVDKNGDKKISKDEFIAAVKDLPLPPPMAGGPGKCPFGPGFGGPTGPQAPGCPKDGDKRKLPDAKEIFAKLDKDKDGKLSFDEFNEGVKQVEKMMSEQHRGGPHGMPPFAQQAPGQQFGPGPDGPGPQFTPPPFGPPHHGCPCCQHCGQQQGGPDRQHFGPGPMGGHEPNDGMRPQGPNVPGPHAGRGPGGHGPEADRGDRPCHGDRECPMMQGKDGKMPPRDGGKPDKDLEAKIRDLEAKIKILQEKVGIK